MGKKRPRTFKRMSPKKIAEALGAEHITDPKEKAEFERKYRFPHPLIPRTKHKK